MLVSGGQTNTNVPSVRLGNGGETPVSAAVPRASGPGTNLGGRPTYN